MSFKQQQIKIKDFRNARYQGFLNLNDQLQGIGLLLDDQFTFVLAQWAEDNLNGDCFVMFPNEQLFYGHFINGIPHGICCFDTTDSCRIFIQFQNGRIVGDIASVFEEIDFVVHTSLSDSGVIKVVDQINYSDSITKNNELFLQELEIKKWQIAQNIIKGNISKDMKQLNRFIRKNLIQKYPDCLDYFQIANKQQYFFGIRDQGLGIRFQQQKFKSVGFLDKAKVMNSIGKKLINKQKQVREQGLYDVPQSLFRYQFIKNRPNQSKKVLRNFYKKSLYFRNKFCKIQILQELNHLFDKIKVNIRQNTVQKIAQQLLQNPIPLEFSYTHHISNNMNRFKNQPKQQKKNAPIQTTNIRKQKQEVSTQKLKQELNRTLSKNKNTKNSYTQHRDLNKYNSSYKDHSPAQLKYTSRKTPQVQYKPEKISNYRQNNKILDQLSSLNIQSSSFIHQPQRKTGKIRYNNNKSQTKNTQVLTDSPNKFPQKIYANLQLKQKVPYNAYSPSKNQKHYQADKISDLYDRYQNKQARLQQYNKLQQKNRNGYRKYLQEDSPQKYVKKSPSRNMGQRYHYNDHLVNQNPEIYGNKYTSSRKTQIPEKNHSPYQKNRSNNMDRASTYYQYRYRNN